MKDSYATTHLINPTHEKAATLDESRWSIFPVEVRRLPGSSHGPTARDLVFELAPNVLLLIAIALVALLPG